MTLKQALISESFYRDPKDPNIIYINLSQILNVEKLIEEIATQSFHDGTLDGVGAIFGKKESRFSNEYWQENKERWLGK